MILDFLTALNHAENAKLEAGLRYRNALVYAELVAERFGVLGPEYAVALSVLLETKRAFVETMDVIVDLYTGTVRAPATSQAEF